MPVKFTPALIDQIIKGRCPDFAAMMGMRKTKSAELQINVFLPGATAVDVLQRNGKKVLLTLTELHHEGLFSGTLAGKKAVPYKLRVQYGTTAIVQHDPYRFPSRLDKAEMQLFAQGQHESTWQLLGAQPCSIDDVDGVQFVLWAPEALRVSLLCDMNRWDGRCHVMRCHQAYGLWELFMPDFAVPENGEGLSYKFEVLTADQRYLSLPFDPFARRVSKRPVFCTHLEAEGAYRWQDHFWQQVGRDGSGQGRAIAIREISINVAPDEHRLNWKRVMMPVLEEIRTQGFTHVLLTARSALAVSDQRTVCGLLAPDPALGSPDDLRAFIDHAHQLELGVLWDLPLLSALYSLGCGDQPIALLEPQVDGPLLSILLGYFSYWRESFHIDGFRVRDLDMLLQRQAPKAPGKTKTRNARNAPETDNPFVREWLGQLLQKLRKTHPGLLMLAETSVQQEPFTQSLQLGGLGFDYRIRPCDPAKADPAPMDLQTRIREWLLLLQDGNRDQSLLSLPWQQVACGLPGHAGQLLTLLMLALWTLPGRKHVQLDCTVRQGKQWKPDAGDDWELQQPPQWPLEAARLLRELNHLYQASPCLYEVDASHEGIAVLPASEGVLAWQRKGRQANEVLLVALNTGSAAVTAEISVANAGQYRLRYHTPESDGHLEAFPKVVHGVTDIAAGGNVSRGQKLLLKLPAFSGAVYAWQG